MSDALTPSELKIILHSKRSNIYYLQYCRVWLTALAWVLGLPHGFAIVQDKIWRGGVVFDVAQQISQPR